ncbi:hypothetical protein P170DRAFT_259292 [Aspergillus steynii IBT 23096]|uniref:Uncharacterized protein n=1 Tax=Aspergillus steynii IBT 23096 TaxID=1392250 RepID=A0A2I2FZJ5_9EURO|nr:uncharacterized protein P170DRAFT_259292 [Aspergillus steynii IBT 23096]PLB46052.1 hypothetical protein P170DRAFT_259292 [Aspergillus steynii IBT 23096]
MVIFLSPLVFLAFFSLYLFSGGRDLLCFRSTWDAYLFCFISVNQIMCFTCAGLRLHCFTVRSMLLWASLSSMACLYDLVGNPVLSVRRFAEMFCRLTTPTEL